MKAGNPTLGVEPLSTDELEDRSRSGIVLDVRTEQEYGDGHVPDAKNLPVGRLRERTDELGMEGEQPVTAPSIAVVSWG